MKRGIEVLADYLMASGLLKSHTNREVVIKELDKFRKKNMLYVLTWRNVREVQPALSKKECKEILDYTKASNPHLDISKHFEGESWLECFRPKDYVKKLLKKYELESTFVEVTDEDID